MKPAQCVSKRSVPFITANWIVSLSSHGWESTWCIVIFQSISFAHCVYTILIYDFYRNISVHNGRVRLVLCTFRCQLSFSTECTSNIGLRVARLATSQSPVARWRTLSNAPIAGPLRKYVFKINLPTFMQWQDAPV